MVSEKVLDVLAAEKPQDHAQGFMRESMRIACST
jgi:hypothetical protein